MGFLILDKWTAAKRKIMAQYHYLDPNRPPRRSLREMDAGQSARRLFGWDFTFVVFFLAIAFYFFWPRMFQNPLSSAPESAIRDAMAVFLEAKDRCNDLIEGATGTISHEAWRTALEPIHPKAAENTLLFLWQKPGTVIVGKENWPEEWDTTNPPWLHREPYAFIDRREGKACLILFEPFPQWDSYLAAVQPFAPIFQGNGGAKP